MAQQYATGSVHVFTRFVGEAIRYFGTCESFPQDTRMPEYEMLMNDLTGSRVPLDVAYQGESAQVSMVMTRWNNTLAEEICTPPGVGVSAGQWRWQDVGTLMSLEDYTTELWLVYTFGSALANKAAYTANGLIAGRHYHQTVLWSPQSDETGTRPMKRHFMFYAWPFYDSSAKTLTLWDTDMTGISANMIV